MLIGDHRIYRHTLPCCAVFVPLASFVKCYPGGKYWLDGPDDALYAKMESGWIDTELFIT